MRNKVDKGHEIRSLVSYQVAKWTVSKNDFKSSRLREVVAMRELTVLSRTNYLNVDRIDKQTDWVSH